MSPVFRAFAIVPDEGPHDAERERPQEADLLAPGQQQPREKADHQPGYEKSDHGARVPVATDPNPKLW